MTQTTQDLVLHYFMIGTGFTLLLDLIIRFVKTSEPYTASEVLASIFLWPVMVIVFIINFIKGFRNV
jgi:hypothetical protein